MATRTRIIVSILMLLIMLIILPILSSVLESFLEDYRSNLSLVPENFIIKTAASGKTYINFFTKASPTNILGWGVIGLFLAYSLFGLAGLKLQKRYAQKDDYGSHGTSRFQTPGEVKKHYFKDNLGWVLGSNTADLKYFIGMP